MSDFAQRLLAWQAHHGRHDLPWQNTTDAYRVWLSEIMLQQTQVSTVIPYYQRFLARFPTLADLAAAPSDEVMAHWAGLGYYARARNLHACAKAVAALPGGDFPRDPLLIAQLPGIGRSTANAIAAFCFGAATPIMDGNVKRVLSRCFAVEGFPGTPAVERQLWALAESLAPQQETGRYNQAQMDLGATVCTRSRPRCDHCPVAEICLARRDGRQAELPSPKPKKVLPERESRFLFLVSDGGVWLSLRPPSGIWGGLWVPPELPAAVADAQLADWAAMELGVEIEPLGEMPALRHTFTHFRLTLRPLLARALGQTALHDSTLRPFGPADLAQAALPTPIRQLLSQALAE